MWTSLSESVPSAVEPEFELKRTPFEAREAMGAEEALGADVHATLKQSEAIRTSQRA